MTWICRCVDLGCGNISNRCQIPLYIYTHKQQELVVFERTHAIVKDSNRNFNISNCKEISLFMPKCGIQLVETIKATVKLENCAKFCLYHNFFWFSYNNDKFCVHKEDITKKWKLMRCFWSTTHLQANTKKNLIYWHPTDGSTNSIGNYQTTTLANTAECTVIKHWWFLRSHKL